MFKGIIYRYVSSSGKSYIGQTINEAIIDNNIPRTTLITDCLSGRRKTCKNFIWEYGVELYKLAS